MSLFDPADLDELVAVITGEGESADPASLDPTDLSMPGSWVRLDSIRRRTLQHSAQLSCTVFVIAPNVSIPQVLTVLSPLAGRVADRLALARIPAPVWTATNVAVPGYDQPLPALSVPVTINTTP